MPIYDEHGRIISNASPDHSPPTAKLSTPPAKLPLKRLWEGVLALIAILSLAAALYVMRPILTASLVTPPVGSDKAEADVAITNSGHIGITDVQVSCEWNKAIFGGKYTFVMNSLILLTVNSPTKIDAGQTITTFCWQPWALYLNRTGGLFSMGSPTPQHPAPGVDFSFSADGNPVLRHPHDVVPLSVPDLSVFSNYQMTGVDAAIVVAYRVLGIRRTHTIHLVSDDLGQIFWRIMPGSATLPDGIGGFKLTAGGNAMTIRIDRVHHGQ
jgi:hypothetical protein